MRARASSLRMHSFRARADSKGFAMISALVIAVLYFALMQLVFVESILAFRQARSIAARSALHILAEDGVELVMRDFCTSGGSSVTLVSGTATVVAKSRMIGSQRFEIESKATSPAGSASVNLQGRLSGCNPIVETARYLP